MSFILRLLIVATGIALAVPAWAAEGDANAVFLVAAREMRDPYFEKSVVLVTYPPGGLPFGVIINRPLTERLSAVFPDQLAFKDRKEVFFSAARSRARASCSSCIRPNRRRAR